jgi:periplasmic divalent cation tolerance protein
MADALELHVTMPDKERAHGAAPRAGRRGAAACVNIVPGVPSIYQWDGRLQEDEEVLCLIKTRPAVFRARPRPHPGSCTRTRSRDPGVRGRRRQRRYLEWLENRRRRRRGAHLPSIRDRRA